jgi:hypothetical protein
VHGPPSSVPDASARRPRGPAGWPWPWPLLAAPRPPQDPNRPGGAESNIAAILRGRAQPLPPRVTAECRALIARMLNPDPEARASLEVWARAALCASRLTTGRLALWASWQRQGLMAHAWWQAK